MTEIIAYACSGKPNHLWSAAQFNSALEKNRKDCDIPLVSLAAFAALEAEFDQMVMECFEVVSTTDVDQNGNHIERSVPKHHLLAADVARLEAENDRMRKALAFYAEAWCFTTNPKRGGLEWKPKEELLDDCGNVARAALEKRK